MRINSDMLEKMTSWMNKNVAIPDGWIYFGDSHERYVLGQPGNYNLLVFGVNPSTAVAGKDDPTIRKVRRIVEHDGYDGWIMVNLYPLVSTNPNKLPQEPDDRIIKYNLAVIGAVAKSYPIGGIWAAWGDLIDKRFFLGNGLYDIQEILGHVDAQWYYRGTLTKKGNPRHPLYMKLEEKMNWFNVADYAAELRFANMQWDQACILNDAKYLNEQ